MLYFALIKHNLVILNIYSSKLISRNISHKEVLQFATQDYFFALKCKTVTTKASLIQKKLLTLGNNSKERE